MIVNTKSVKEGQIYKTLPTATFKSMFVIKNINSKEITMLSTTGKERIQNIQDSKKLNFGDMSLIANYNTWQEAVKSKEFQGLI